MIQRAEAETSTTFLATVFDSAGGQVSVFFEVASGGAFICAMWVSPEVRRQAVGSRLVEVAYDCLKERGATEVHA